LHLDWLEKGLEMKSIGAAFNGPNSPQFEELEKGSPIGHGVLRGTGRRRCWNVIPDNPSITDGHWILREGYVMAYGTLRKINYYLM